MESVLRKYLAQSSICGFNVSYEKNRNNMKRAVNTREHISFSSDRLYAFEEFGFHSEMYIRKQT